MKNDKFDFCCRLFTVFIVLVFWGLSFVGASEHTRSPEKNVMPQGGGIVFFSTQMPELLREFYVSRIGCEVWLDQGSCVLYRFGNMLFAFCEADEAEKSGLITFFFKSKDDVDKAYAELDDIAVSSPEENKKYSIYHFYAKDPEGRSLEFQYFMHPVDWDIRIR